MMDRLVFRTTWWHPLSTMTPDEQKREVARLDYETLTSDAAERLKYQVDLGQSMLRSLTLVNGGALIALFTLIGNQGQGLVVNDGLLKGAFVSFVAGLVFSLVGSFGGFLSQFWYAFASTLVAWDKQEEMLGGEGSRRLDALKHYKRGSWALAIGVLAVVLSVVCFGVGSWYALSGAIEISR